VIPNQVVIVPARSIARISLSLDTSSLSIPSYPILPGEPLEPLEPRTTLRILQEPTPAALAYGQLVHEGILLLDTRVTSCAEKTIRDTATSVC
jgi:hypothetical protein